MTFADGRKYDGNWQNGVKHGIGIISKDGQTSKVKFNEGKFVKYLD